MLSKLILSLEACTLKNIHSHSMRLLSSEIHCGLAFSDQLLDMFLDKQKNSSKIEVKIIDMDNGRDWQIRILL